MAVLLFLALVIGSTQARASDVCAACGQLPGKTVYFFTSPYSKERLMVCPPCAQTKDRCEICRLPLRTNYTVLKDGRWLCQADYSKAVFSQDEARRLFDDVKRKVVRMFDGAGTAPDQNIRVYLVDRGELEGLARVQFYPHDRSITLGLTRSKHLKPGESEHEIYLLSGLKRSRLQAVIAHEYTHAWLNQNLEEKRRIQVDTAEGFCDLAAYNVMSEIGETSEMNIIETSTYSNGQIKAMLGAQEKHRFYNLIKWMKNGTDETLEPGNPNRILALKESPAQQWGWLPQVQSAAPERLVLKSITGTPARRFALLNNQTLATGEAAKVRVGTTNVAVRCLRVTEKSVVVQIGDAKELTELFLENSIRAEVTPREAIPLGPQP